MGFVQNNKSSFFFFDNFRCEEILFCRFELSVCGENYGKCVRKGKKDTSHYGEKQSLVRNLATKPTTEQRLDVKTFGKFSIPVRRSEYILWGNFYYLSFFSMLVCDDNNTWYSVNLGTSTFIDQIFHVSDNKGPVYKTFFMKYATNVGNSWPVTLLRNLFRPWIKSVKLMWSDNSNMKLNDMTWGQGPNTNSWR